MYWHIAPVTLAPGSIILPGNFGRIIKATGFSHPLWNREMELEAVRKMNFADKPSRLDSCFVFSNADTARCYREKHSPTNLMYMVEILQTDLPMHVGDFNAVEPLPGRTENQTQIAHLYWSYGLKTNVQEWPGVLCDEVLTASPIRILSLIN